MTMNSDDTPDYKKEAIKTYLEQTKVLVSLASAFVIAPAIAKSILPGVSMGLFVAGELLLIASVFCGYVVFGTIAGNQHRNEFNVYSPSTVWWSRIEIATFLLGLALFGWMVFCAGPTEDPSRTPTPLSSTPSPAKPTSSPDDVSSHETGRDAEKSTVVGDERTD